MSVQYVKITQSGIEWETLNQYAKSMGFSDFENQLRSELYKMSAMNSILNIGSGAKNSSIVYPVPAESMGVIKKLSERLHWPYAKVISKFIMDPILVEHLICQHIK